MKKKKDITPVQNDKLYRKFVKKFCLEVYLSSENKQAYYLRFDDKVTPEKIYKFIEKELNKRKNYVGE